MFTSAAAVTLIHQIACYSMGMPGMQAKVKQKLPTDETGECYPACAQMHEEKAGGKCLFKDCLPLRSIESEPSKAGGSCWRAKARTCMLSVRGQGSLLHSARYPVKAPKTTAYLRVLSVQ